MLIYRVEDIDGKGPFADEQKLCKYLNVHEDPINMLTSVGLTKAEFNKKMEDGFLFGWKDEELYTEFFQKRKKNYEQFFYAKGMKKMMCESTEYYVFEDGQVMFNPNCIKTDITPKLKSKVKMKG